MSDHPTLHQNGQPVTEIWPNGDLSTAVRGAMISEPLDKLLKAYAEDVEETPEEIIFSLLIGAIMGLFDPEQELENHPLSYLLPADVETICAIGARIHGCSPESFAGLLIEAMARKAIMLSGIITAARNIGEMAAPPAQA